jgi:hypothetical protein
MQNQHRRVGESGSIRVSATTTGGAQAVYTTLCALRDLLRISSIPQIGEFWTILHKRANRLCVTDTLIVDSYERVAFAFCWNFTNIYIVLMAAIAHAAGAIDDRMSSNQADQLSLHLVQKNAFCRCIDHLHFLLTIRYCLTYIGSGHIVALTSSGCSTARSAPVRHSQTDLFHMRMPLTLFT